jgi:glycosyltransferase involved in cell wall biosynthesis
MRVQLVDPSAFTPPYDRAIAAALARQGAEVELLTSRFLYGPVPPAEGYRVDECFYRRSAARGLEAPGRRAFKAAEHVADMLRFRRGARTPARAGTGPEPGEGSSTGPDVVHYQWLTFPGFDARLLPPTRPRVMTAHYVLPPRPSRRQLAGARRSFGAMDAVVAHSEHGARRLREVVGLDPDRVRVIHHGAFDYLTRLPEEMPLAPELEGAEGPVILFFGLLRPYKGIDILLEAFRQVKGAELWIAGNPRMDLAPLQQLAAEAPGPVRFLPRFVEDAEIPALMRRADMVVLPYRDVEHSGVLYAALAFGKPLVLSAVGGFPEVAEQGAARLVPPEDPASLAAALAELVGDESARAELAEAAARAAAGSYSWDEAASQTLALYRELLDSTRRSGAPFAHIGSKMRTGSR